MYSGISVHHTACDFTPNIWLKPNYFEGQVIHELKFAAICHLVKNDGQAQSMRAVLRGIFNVELYHRVLLWDFGKSLIIGMKVEQCFQARLDCFTIPAVQISA